MNGSASPKAAIGPVRGLTWPILMTRDWALAGSTRSTAGAATAPSPAAMMRRRLMVPGCFMATSLADGSKNLLVVGARLLEMRHHLGAQLGLLLRGPGAEPLA